MSITDNTDTIAAIATAAGRGGVGIVRVSGPKAAFVAQQLLAITLTPRHAHYCNFFSHKEFSCKQELIDKGLALFFPSPHSYTGEDVLELQGHGGPVVLDLLLSEILQLGVRLARPGEFSERAFLNNKIDLVQAEAIADLINASHQQAARNAINSLQGVFSQQIKNLVEQLIQLRIYVEAAIDFPEEEIDFLSDGKVATDLEKILQTLQNIIAQTQQGVLLREGIRLVIAGKPNAGKSSLLNALTGNDTAIVTPIAGTTRDILREQIHIDGIPLHLIDTAGLRESDDTVEKIGITRAWQEIEKADRILLVVDASENSATDVQQLWPEFIAQLHTINNETLCEKIILVRNKIDLINEKTGLVVTTEKEKTYINISAKNNAGITDLKQHLKHLMGFTQNNEGQFTARRRHLDALNRAQDFLLTGKSQLMGYNAGELLAEDLRQTQNALNEITGEFTPDDLLGRIFSDFCIGK
jgi:tRNA modification GTPase